MNVYRGALIPRKLSCHKKFLVTRLQLQYSIHYSRQYPFGNFKHLNCKYFNISLLSRDQVKSAYVVTFLIIWLVSLEHPVNWVVQVVDQQWRKESNHNRVCVFLKKSMKDLSSLHKKWSFPLRTSSVNWPSPQFPVDLVIFNEEILNGKLPIFVQCLCWCIHFSVYFFFIQILLLMFYSHSYFKIW